MKLWVKLVVLLGVITAVPASIPPLPLQDVDPMLGRYEDATARNNRERELIATEDLRLPLEVVPIHYRIVSKPILDDIEGETRFTAPGSVTVSVRAMQAVDTITLHAFNDTIRIDAANLKVTRKDGNVGVNVSDQIIEPLRDFYVIKLGENLVVGEEYIIEIHYVAILSEVDSVGYYRGFYVNPETNETRYLSTTKFEPFHARKAFPGFDEPELKATFEIVLGRKPEYHSLSNMIIKSTETDDDGWVWDTYDTSPLMSTYLVCMIVSDFTSEEKFSDALGKFVKIWAAPHYIAEGAGKVGVDFSVSILTYYQNLFGIEYTLPKMDTIALPQFPSGAMENWGLNTYREEYLVYFPGDSTERSRYDIGSVIAHELSHQWFGNLVTCKWWSEIWLNEGFATYWTIWGHQIVAPEFDLDKRFYIDKTAPSMIFDKSAATHPIKNSAGTPGEIASVFDGISYGKAGAVLRMLERVMGVTALHTALKKYLKEMMFMNAEQDDLFDYIQEEAEGGLKIKEILDSWTLQSGYPLVRVAALGESVITISQERYSNNASSAISDTLPPHSSYDGNVLWEIPVGMVSADNPDFSNASNLAPVVWIHKNEILKAFTEGVDTKKWLILNPEDSGFYRVLYDDVLLGKIQEQFDANAFVFPPTTRAQLMNDYFNFAVAGHSSYANALTFTKYLRQDVDIVPWTIAISHLRPIIQKFGSSAAHLEALKKYLVPILNETMESLGFQQAGDAKGNSVMLRALLWDYASALGHEKSIKVAEVLYVSWESAGTRVPADLRALVYCNGVRGNVRGDLAFSYLLKKYVENPRDRDASKYLNALACSKNRRKLEELLNNTISENPSIRENDFPGVLQAVASNSDGRDLVLRFIVNNLGNGLTPPLYAVATTALANFVVDPVEVEMLREHVASNEDALEDVLGTVNANLERMEQNVAWMEKQGEEIRIWLENNS